MVALNEIKSAAVVIVKKEIEKLVEAQNERAKQTQTIKKSMFRGHWKMSKGKNIETEKYRKRLKEKNTERKNI